MSFKELEIKTSYDSTIDNVLDEFYIKVLKKSVYYKRIAGFFSSSTLLVCSQGIEGLLKNNGKMKLIVSPNLSAEDIEIINLAQASPEVVIEKALMNNLKDIDSIEESIKVDHVNAFGWLLAKGYIEIKIAVVKSQKGQYLNSKEINQLGLFHMKVGILEDSDGNIISFSGSINETLSAWKYNVEEFKVFKSWIDAQKDYCMSDVKKFDDIWYEKRPDIILLNIPEAIKEKIINVVPKDYNLKKIVDSKNRKNANFGLDIELFEYQKDAIKKWITNNKSLIFQMATGTGKTITALGCISAINDNFNQIVYFIVCPQNTLFMQWKKDIERFNIRKDKYIIADSTNINWKIELEKTLLKVDLGILNRVFVYTTFSTFSTFNFMNIVGKNKGNLKYMLIVDEVHGIGSKTYSKGLLNCYDFRLGLSATPERWFDEKGTKLINRYFGNEKFIFDMKSALNTINPITGKTYLTPYEYIPLIGRLSYDEVNEYNLLSKKIGKSINNPKIDEEIVENLIFQRAKIHKDAKIKIDLLKEILILENNKLDNTIIFLSNNQMEEVIKLLSQKKIRSHKFTQDKGIKKLSCYNYMSEREMIIDRFKRQDYDTLLAIKCLDEGIDIPSADKAILMSNSTNPREYIQRIGRVIRRYEKKEISRVYDMIIVPSYEKIDPKLKKVEFQIFKKEMERVKYIAKNATNHIDLLLKFQDLERRLLYEFEKNR